MPLIFAFGFFFLMIFYAADFHFCLACAAAAFFAACRLILSYAMLLRLFCRLPLTRRCRLCLLLPACYAHAADAAASHQISQHTLLLMSPCFRAALMLLALMI